MSKKQVKYYETKYIVRSKRKNAISKFFLFGLLIVVFGGIILFSGLFSKFLKISNLSVLFNKNQLEFKQHSYYALAMAKANSSSSAQTLASKISVAGAGSYIWKFENLYYVLGNIYPTKKEAEIVVKNISSENFKPEILEVKFPKIKVANENLSIDQNRVVFDSVSNFSKIYKKCYNYCNQFDKKEIEATILSSELNTLKGNVIIWANKIDLINSIALSQTTLQIKNAYIKLGQELDTAVLKIIDGKNSHKDIKYLCSAIAIIKFDLFNNINNL